MDTRSNDDVLDLRLVELVAGEFEEVGDGDSGDAIRCVLVAGGDKLETEILSC
jgi:hypothetical protein